MKKTILIEKCKICRKGYQTFIVFLRGINVGGNSLIKMVDLKSAIENCGFNNVRTFIQSGNVILESNKDSRFVINKIQRELTKVFKIKILAVVKSKQEIKRIIDNAPEKWKNPNNLRRYMLFIIKPKTVNDVFKELTPKEGIDEISKGKDVLYLSTKLSEKSRSGFIKFISNPLYKYVTIRDYSTVQRIIKILK